MTEQASLPPTWRVLAELLTIALVWVGYLVMKGLSPNFGAWHATLLTVTFWFGVFATTAVLFFCSLDSWLPAIATLTAVVSLELLSYREAPPFGGPRHSSWPSGFEAATCSTCDSRAAPSFSAQKETSLQEGGSCEVTPCA